MMIQGTVDIQSLDTQNMAGYKKNRPLRSCVMISKFNECYYVSVKNSMYPNNISYKITDLEKVFTKFMKQRKLGIQFKKPKHLVLIESDDQKLLDMFYRQLKDIVQGKNVAIDTRQMPKTVPKKTVNKFDPMCTEFITDIRFDSRILNMKNLTKLVLENCVITSLPEELGNLPIVTLSLSGCKLMTLKHEHYTLWNWTCNDTICNTLKVLKMDSMELIKIPFEIIFLTNLYELHVAKNKLIYIPHFVGDLEKLLYLDVSDNMLTHLPDSLYQRTFHQLDMSNNNFLGMLDDHNSIPDHMHTYRTLINNSVSVLKNTRNSLYQKPSVTTLSGLAFISLRENRVRFKRQDIPRTLWHLYDVTARCVHCYKYALPDHSFVSYCFSAPAARNFVTHHRTCMWQSVTCCI